MSFNLCSQDVVEALFVFTSIMAENGYRVMSTQYRVINGKKVFTVEYVPMNNPDLNWIECEFEYAKAAHNMRVKWHNQGNSKEGKLFIAGIHAGHAGQWSNFRPIVAEIFIK